VHSEYSILDGAAKLDDLIQAAVEDGQPAIASTDHGNLYAALEFYKKCKKAGLKYIPGQEFYMAAESVDERPTRGRAKIDDTGGTTDRGKKVYYHITLLAESNEGFSNLIKLSSRAFLEGFYYKPRVDWEMLAEHSRGVIATSGCLGGVVLQDLLHDDEEGAYSKAGRLQEIFGQENFFMELQNHDLPEQHKTNPALIRIAKKLRAPLLATNDCHYVHRHDAKSHDSLLCLQTGALRSDEKRFKFTGEEHYLKTAAEMRYLFSELPDSCDNTLWIAERSNVSLENTTGYKLPKFKVPEGFVDDNEYLKTIVYHGASERWGDLAPLVKSRLEYELGVIKDMGFPSYFLILWDIVRHAREKNILTGPGRGSAAGCAVAYCLGITKIDPIKYDLLFERFLNPSRISMPDIDLDMDSRYRDDLIKYAAEIYGEDHVAQVITFGQIKARAAVRGSARVLGEPWAAGDAIVKAMPPVTQGRVTPLSACLVEEKGHEEAFAAAKGVRDMNRDPDYQEIIEVALGLEGLRQNDSIHAAAVVISDSPLTDYLPIQRKGEGKQIVTQYEMNNVEELGLLKMDFLGLRNLDTIDIAVKLILKNTGDLLDVDNLDLEDKSTFKILRQGDTFGVFQLEGSQMRDLLRRLNPESIHDVAAVVALYRPGPMASNMHNDYADRKNGRQEVTYFHEDAEEVLKDTYGLMIYQEQMMRIAQRFAGYSLAEADNLRKACGKKIRELMAKEKDKLINGVILSGYTEELAHYIWDMIEPFADYSFNKSHAYAYGFIAYATAYLKANHPIEYMAALLTSTTGDNAKTALYLGECKRLGIEVLLPDINQSEVEFQPKNGKILFGLLAIKGVGDVAAEEVVKCRKERQFTDLVDFGERMSEHVNKTVIQALIQGGAFDAFGGRKSMIEAIPEIQKTAKRVNKEKASGAMTLFDMPPILTVSSEDYERSERIRLEKEVLAVYISDHPLNGLVHLYENPRVTVIPELVDCFGFATIVGLVSNSRVITTKKGDPMSFVEVEDLYGTVEVVVFPKTYKDCSHLLKENELVQVKGRVDSKDETLKFIAQGITSITTTVGDE